MRKFILYVLALIVLVAAAVVVRVSCKNDSYTARLAEEETSIYAVVVHQLATVDDTFGGNLKPPVLYIIRNTDDKAGNPVLQKSNSVLISKDVQKRLTKALNSLSAEIVWIDNFEDAAWETGPGSKVKGGGVIITLGNIYRQVDSSVQVAGSIYIANLGAGGTTYILEKMGDVWVITGRTGVTWMS